MGKTTLIVAAVVIVTLLFGILLTRRLIATWHPEHPRSARSVMTTHA